MVSLKDFILVEDQKNFDVEKFYADCKPFLEEIRGIREEDLPKHGSKLVPSTWKIKSITSQEKSHINFPNDSPVELYNAIDNYFKAQFGWRARSQSISTTGEYNQAARRGHGSVALCFPIGKNFKTLWSNEIVDLDDWYYNFEKKFISAKYGRGALLAADEIDEMTPSIIEEAIEKIKNMKWHYNENLKRGYRSGREVLVDADKVYLINYDSLKEHNKIIDYLKLSKVII